MGGWVGCGGAPPLVRVRVGRVREDLEELRALLPADQPARLLPPRRAALLLLCHRGRRLAEPNARAALAARPRVGRAEPLKPPPVVYLDLPPLRDDAPPATPASE